MSGRSRALWTVTLLFFVCGCSTYRAASKRHFDPRKGRAENFRHSVEEGDEVRITLNDGNLVKGRVIQADQRSIAVVPIDREWIDDAEVTAPPVDRDRAPAAETIVPTADIRRIEVSKFDIGKTFVLVGTSVAALFVIAFVSVASSL